MLPVSIDQIDLHIPLTPLLLFVVAAVILLGWIIFTVIIRYHWKNYSIGGVQIFTMNFFYLTGSVVIGGFMMLTALLYYFSAQ